MNTFTETRFNDLLAIGDGPCLSLYQTTHRSHPDNQQDPIRFRNLVDTLGESLAREYPQRDVKPLLAPLRTLLEDHEFWQHTLDGLVVLRNADRFEVFRLQRPVGELAVVADSFHTKPLMRILQSADRYQVLALSRNRFRLYEGNRDALDELTLPREMHDQVVTRVPEPDRVVRTEGNRQGRADWTDIERDRYFRAVDRAVLQRQSKETALPLLLAALPEHHSAFRAVSHNPYLLREGLQVAPDALALDELRTRTWKAIEPRYLARLSWLVNGFGSAIGTGLASDDPTTVGRAVVAGAVGTLLVEAGRSVGGRLDRDSGEVRFADIAAPDVGDVLDDIAEEALRRGAEVVVVPSERMPVATGLAATFRF